MLKLVLNLLFVSKLTSSTSSSVSREIILDVFRRLSYESKDVIDQVRIFPFETTEDSQKAMEKISGSELERLEIFARKVDKVLDISSEKSSSLMSMCLVFAEALGIVYVSVPTGTPLLDSIHKQSLILIQDWIRIHISFAQHEADNGLEGHVSAPLVLAALHVKNIKKVLQSLIAENPTLVRLKLVKAMVKRLGCALDIVVEGKGKTESRVDALQESRILLKDTAIALRHTADIVQSKALKVHAKNWEILYRELEASYYNLLPQIAHSKIF
jgi:hypothetical protein